MHRLSLILTLVAAVSFPSYLTAQARGAVSASTGRTTFIVPQVMSGPGLTIGFGAYTHPFPPAAGVFLGTPFFYPDYPYHLVAVPQPAPEIFVMQAPAPAAQTKEETRSAEPLLIEWREDHFVRSTETVTEAEAGRGRVQPHGTGGLASRSGVAHTSASPQQPHELPPNVLVFRNGQCEEITNYAIIGSVLYENSDYWTTGSWSRKIQVADLDLPATFRLNQERGVKFALPAGPNQVVTRP